MAGIKEIRTRIDSVQQTLKITNAMYLISSSKLRKARQQFNAVQPFFQKVTETISSCTTPRRWNMSILTSVPMYRNIPWATL